MNCEKSQLDYVLMVNENYYYMILIENYMLNIGHDFITGKMVKKNRIELWELLFQIVCVNKFHEKRVIIAS